MLRKLLAVLVVTAVVLTALPVQAAPAASDRDGALLRLTDWVTELVGHLVVLVGADESGPTMDPHGNPLTGDPTPESQAAGEPIDTTTEAGPEMDPNG
jgi:hypothetical protein